MALRIVVGIVALVCSAICGIATTLVNTEMVYEVNERLPEGSRFELAGWYFTKYQRLHREYKRLYPSGRLLLKVRAITAAAFGCLVICVWGFGILGA